ncbi:protein-S-isoprenylcysteine O-methyltransferase [Trifolium repens]|nr:protein-S-isoprenylcysteine O-methyltransferase [Trifolium repens]
MTEIFSYTACRQLSQMFLAVIFFHVSEYFLAAVIHGKSSVTLKSLLISKHYLLAMIFSLLEYLIEIALFPDLKEHWVISDFGLVLVVIGEILRKMAIITAGQSFTHIIRVRPDERHKLVTNVVVWKFFSTRIPYEEYFLRQFFGMQLLQITDCKPADFTSAKLFWVASARSYPSRGNLAWVLFVFPIIFLTAVSAIESVLPTGDGEPVIPVHAFHKTSNRVLPTGEPVSLPVHVYRLSEPVTPPCSANW